jgi:hypothetical protein
MGIKDYYIAKGGKETKIGSLSDVRFERKLDSAMMLIASAEGGTLKIKAPQKDAEGCHPFAAYSEIYEVSGYQKDNVENFDSLLVTPDKEHPIVKLDWYEQTYEDLTNARRPSAPFNYVITQVNRIK